MVSIFTKTKNMYTHFHRKNSVFPVIKNSNFQIFPKSSPILLQDLFAELENATKSLKNTGIRSEYRVFLWLRRQDSI